MIPAIDVPTELTNCKAAPEGLIKEEQEEMFALNTRNYGQDLTKLTTKANAGERALNWIKLIEKSVIVHRDENGFGLRIKGQSPVYVEHVHENGAAWRAGVRPLDRLSKVNGIPVVNMDHKDVVLIFKSCSRFVGLTLLTCLESYADCQSQSTTYHSRQASSYGRNSSMGSMRFVLEDSANFPDDSYDDSTSRSWRYSAEPSPCDLKPGSYYEGTILDAHQQLTVGKAAHRSQSSQSFNLTHLAAQQPVLNGNTNYYLNYHPSSKTTPAPSARTASPADGKQPPADAFGGGPTAFARRSESVSLRPSYLGKQQLAIPAHLNERRISVSINKHQIVAVCIDCRKQVVRGQIEESHSCNECQKLRLSRDLNQKNRITFDHEESPKGAEDTQLDMKRLTCAAANKRHDSSYKLTQSGSLDAIVRHSGGSGKKSTLANGVVVSGGQNKQATRSTPVNKRMEIIREFIDTERTHTERLRCLDELFYRPLKVGNYMTSEQLRSVFSCHRTLYKIHRQIYRILRSANYNLFSEPLVGSALREIFESDLKRRLEKAACLFCAAQSTNAELLNKLTRRETKVGDFLAQVTSQQMIGRLGIKDLLASCFQRLTKYPLLLENLLKATPVPPAANRKRFHRGGEGEHDKAEAGLSDDFEEDEEEEEEEEVRNARRMLAISLAEEREFIERALQQSRQILVKVNESVKVAMSHNKLKEIWKRTDKYPGVPLIDITNQQMVHDGLLTLRLSKRSFDVYVLLLNDYIIILTREGQDKYRLKFFTPEGKSSALTSSSTSSQTVYSPVFVIDEHLATRDAATDENGFYLLCKRKDDSRIYEFASRSPAERMKWRDRIQWTIERQIGNANRRQSCKFSSASKFRTTEPPVLTRTIDSSTRTGESTLTKSSSEISAKQETDEVSSGSLPPNGGNQLAVPADPQTGTGQPSKPATSDAPNVSEEMSPGGSKAVSQPTKIEGTISYVEDDGIVMPSKIESSRALVEQAIQVNIVDLDSSKNVQLVG